MGRDRWQRMGQGRRRTRSRLRLGRAVDACHWHAPPLSTLRVPRARAFTHEKTDERKPLVRFLAGAEGLEPSARGFGVDAKKTLRRKTFRSFQRLTRFCGFAFSEGDTFLMLCALLSRPPHRIHPSELQRLLRSSLRAVFIKSNGQSFGPVQFIPLLFRKSQLLR